MSVANLLIVAPAYASDHPRLVHKIAVGMIERNWSVALVAHRGRSTPDGLNLVSVPLRSGLNRLLGLPRLMRIVYSSPFDVVLAVGVEAWFACVMVGLVRRKCVAFDAMEDYVGRAEYLCRGRMAQTVLRRCISLTLRLLSARTELVVLSRSNLAADYPARLSVTLHNFYQPSLGVAAPTHRGSATSLRVVHTGIISEERGSLILVEALERCVQSGIRLELKMIGKFADSSDVEFRRRINLLGDAVKFEEIPWCSLELAMQHLRNSHLGLTLFQPVTSNLRNSMPNKVFDYMANGLPVIAPSWPGELTSLLAPSGAALLVDTSSAEEVADAIARLYLDEDLRYTLAVRANEMTWSSFSLAAALDALAAKLCEAKLHCDRR